MHIEIDETDVGKIADTVLKKLLPHINTRTEDKVFDVPGLADYLNVDASWVYDKVRFQQIPYFKAGRYTRFKKSDIDKWIAQQTVKPVP